MIAHVGKERRYRGNVGVAPPQLDNTLPSAHAPVYPSPQALPGWGRERLHGLTPRSAPLDALYTSRVTWCEVRSGRGRRQPVGGGRVSARLADS